MTMESSTVEQYAGIEEGKESHEDIKAPWKGPHRILRDQTFLSSVAVAAEEDEDVRKGWWQLNME